MTKVIGRPIQLILVVVVLVAVGLAGCGGSGSSNGWSATQKQKLEKVLTEELNADAGKVGAQIQADLNAVKDCVFNEVTGHFSPSSANTAAVNKALTGACGSLEKKAGKALKAAADKAAGKTLSSGG